MPRQTEPNANNALGELLRWMMPGCEVRSENTQTFPDYPGRHADVLIAAPGRSPVVVEAEYEPAAEVDRDASERLGLRVQGQPRTVEAAIAVRYPLVVEDAYDVRQVLSEIRLSYYVLYQDGTRFPESGWLQGSATDLADLARLVSVPQKAVEQAADPVLNDCVRILSLFGKMGRYYNLDVVAGASNGPIDPKGEWEALESRVEDPIPYLGNLERLHHDYYPRVNSALIARMERLVRAIAMQFTLGGHADRGGELRRLSVVYQEFRNLRDDQFGTVDYRRSVEILRGDTDQWIRRSDQEIATSGWPSLAVSKAEFGGEWPFRDDRVTVECCDGLFYIVNIGGYDFALNGAARSRFGLPFAHDAGVAVLGKSVGPFIDMAHGLSARPKGEAYV